MLYCLEDNISNMLDLPNRIGEGAHRVAQLLLEYRAALLDLALNFLRERAKTYNEPFTVQLQTFDDTMATISNQ